MIILDNGICSRIANRTLHLESSASSRTLGMRCCWKDSNPTTSWMHSILLIILRRTSAHSSFKNTKNKGTRCCWVFSFPITGDSFMIVEASAVLTCWWGSEKLFKNRKYKFEHLFLKKPDNYSNLWQLIYKVQWWIFWKFRYNAQKWAVPYSGHLNLNWRTTLWGILVKYPQTFFA